MDGKKAPARTTVAPSVRLPSSDEQVVRHVAPPKVELSRNAKREPSWELSLSADDGDLEVAVERLLQIDQKLRARLFGEGDLS